jgi:hypothetical protein
MARKPNENSLLENPSFKITGKYNPTSGEHQQMSFKGESSGILWEKKGKTEDVRKM